MAFGIGQGTGKIKGPFSHPNWSHESCVLKEFLSLAVLWLSRSLRLSSILQSSETIQLFYSRFQGCVNYEAVRHTAGDSTHLHGHPTKQNPSRRCPKDGPITELGTCGFELVTMHKSGSNRLQYSNNANVRFESSHLFNTLITHSLDVNRFINFSTVKCFKSCLVQMAANISHTSVYILITIMIHGKYEITKHKWIKRIFVSINVT